MSSEFLFIDIDCMIIKKYIRYIPGSWFFWWLIFGVLWTVAVIFYMLPWYKILPISNWEEPLSGDSLTLDDTKKAFQEIYDLVSLQYYDTGAIDQTKMSRQAMSAFVDALWDPFSSYLPPAEGKEFTDSIDWKESIEGIWAVLSKKDGGAIIEEVLKSSPAAQAWLQPLDLIVKVNGSGLQTLSIGEIVQQIRWPRWTKVVLTIARTSSWWIIKFIEQEVVRDTIIIPSVNSKIITWKKWESLWYIALSIFAQDTDEKLQIEIKKLKDQKILWLVLDLRWNGGGLLPESVDVASHFLPIGTPVVQSKYRIYSDMTYKAEGNDTLSHIPMVILVNGMTASASEIITLGIKEWRCKNIVVWTWRIQNKWFEKDCDVLIVWEQTFGKWSIQNLQELSFGGSVKLTVGKRFAPSGLSINHIGIAPDIMIPFDQDRYHKDGFDNQLEKAKTILSQND